MKKFFMAVIAIMMTVSVSAQFYIYLSNGEVLQADSISMVSPSTPTPTTPGMLSGKFSVSATKKVHFSQGNLQYQASTQTWRFAENQYDMIGNANSNISASYSGWIDWFGGGTGNNPTNTSMSNSDYSTFVDWGVNAISNGGNEANLWYTLSNDEWVYLFCTRTNAASLFGFGSVNGINGIIILPDSWVTPDGASFTPSTTLGLAYQGGSYYNDKGGNFSHNTYTAEQWSVMESAGAVFLPAAGHRDSTGASDVGAEGCYWSSTPKDQDGAYFLDFNGNSFYPRNSRFRNNGHSVRLVKDL